MSRLLVHVEGETEESFVNELLAPHLFTRGYTSVSARLLGNARSRGRRGGIRAWSAARRDIIRHLEEDAHSRATTMVDYYALPASGERAWPGRADAREPTPIGRSRAVEMALGDDIAQALGSRFDRGRFIPYVVMHEFEGLLFSDCTRFAIGIGQPGLAASFQRIRDAFPSPEEINDSVQTAPSKRVEALLPGYTKPFLGVLAALEIGLEAIRGQCPLFDDWLKRLDA